MSALLQSEGLVLRTLDFGESDRVVHLLTPDAGRLSAIAKGARRSVKRFPGTLDLFNHVTIAIERKRSGLLARLDQARLVHAYPGVRSDASRFALGCYLLELLDRLAPDGGARSDHAALFAFALAALARVESDTPDVALRVRLELHALAALGLRPELARCVRCSEPIQSVSVRFHVADGGPLCERCGAGAEGLPLHLGTLRALEQSLRFPLARADRVALSGHALAEARAMLARFLRFHVGVELRSERFLDERLTPRGPEGKLRASPPTGPPSRD